MTDKNCHGCGVVLSVCDDLVHMADDPFGPLITPKLQAPFICPECRKVPAKLKAARELMDPCLVPVARKQYVPKRRKTTTNYMLGRSDVAKNRA